MYLEYRSAVVLTHSETLIFESNKNMVAIGYNFTTLQDGLQVACFVFLAPTSIRHSKHPGLLAKNMPLARRNRAIGHIKAYKYLSQLAVNSRSNRSETPNHSNLVMEAVDTNANTSASAPLIKELGSIIESKKYDYVLTTPIRDVKRQVQYVSAKLSDQGQETKVRMKIVLFGSGGGGTDSDADIDVRKASTGSGWDWLNDLEREANILTNLNKSQINCAPQCMDYFQLDIGVVNKDGTRSDVSGMVLVTEDDRDRFVALDELVLKRGWRVTVDSLNALIEQLLISIKQLSSMSPPVILDCIDPSNILIRTDGISGNPVEVRFASFAHVSDPTSSSSAQNGVYGYIAPEVYNAGKNSLRSNLFSVGVSILFILSGQDISSWADGKSGLADWRTKLPNASSRSLENVFVLVDRLIKADPRERPDSAEQALQILKEPQRSAPYAPSVSSSSSSQTVLDREQGSSYAMTRKRDYSLVSYANIIPPEGPNLKVAVESDQRILIDIKRSITSVGFVTNTGMTIAWGSMLVPITAASISTGGLAVPFLIPFYAAGLYMAKGVVQDVLGYRLIIDQDMDAIILIDNMNPNKEVGRQRLSTISQIRVDGDRVLQPDSQTRARLTIRSSFDDDDEWSDASTSRVPPPSIVIQSTDMNMASNSNVLRIDAKMLTPAEIDSLLFYLQRIAGFEN